MTTAWMVSVMLALSGVATAGTFIERIDVTTRLHDIDVTVGDASSMDPADYVLVDGDRRLVAHRVEQETAVLAFVVAAGDPMIPTLFDNLALERFSAGVGEGIVIEYDESGARVLARGRLDELRRHPLRSGAITPQRGDVLDAFELALHELDYWASPRAIFVVGDGRLDFAAERRTKLLRWLARSNEVSTFAMVRDSQAGISALIPQTYTSNHVKPDEALRGTVDRFANRKRVNFWDGDEVFDWDGRVHDLNLASYDPADPSPEGVILPRPPAEDEGCCDGKRWWLVALVGSLAILAAWIWSRRAISSPGTSAGN